MHHIRTVTGPLDPSTVTGPVLAHEHLALDLRRDSDDEAVLDARHADPVIRELAGLREAFGLSLVVEQTCRGMGRDVASLARLSAASGVAVIAATGWYYEPFHPQEVGATDVGLLTDTLVRDVHEGIDGTGIAPGVIAEVGSHGERPSEPERRTLTAAARAAVRTGLPVATHAHLGVGGPAQLALLTAEGLPPHRVALGHQDLLDDPAVHRRLAAEGAYVSFDTVGKNGYQSDETRLRLVLELIESGHADRALLSCDISRHGYLTDEGGTGYGHLFHSFLPALRKAGVDADTLDLITRRNPLRFLAGADPRESSDD
ncbi:MULTISPECIES: phosphotriesterase family protein [Streptomyces]|uniref:phosphotriesterase family protein n=1 Tax=Streptomyces TaxID=1883 RepID=UPI0004CDCCF9|nr:MULTISPECIES: phosphotriesterase [Streptomyces]KOX30351.1 phosphotriesterase [Streptomyces sp. NRRL F-4707]KOX46952.1 phosphotriesterase [Streptomyces sp. NRRL F-7442]MCL7368353.1 phosphotriesterase [Streptomyces ardesiacus]NEB60852.1 phosphotriesterase [Streptomyces diastaticus]